MKRNKFALQILTFGFIVISLIACDKDFVNLESDIINNENATNFDILSSPFDIITYTKALDPVQTNSLVLNNIGTYDDVYGRTKSSFVSPVSLGFNDPDFGEQAVIDSVILDIPYFSRTTEIEENGNILYEIDSVIGRNPLKLNIFESNYFIRDFDPTGDFNDRQAYFSNKTASVNEMISDATLEGEALSLIRSKGTSYPIDDMGEENVITISDKGFVLTALDEDGVQQVSLRQPPGIRLKLDPAYWQNKIIDQQGESVLGSTNSFQNYFRGLYFKAETVGPEGSFLSLNLNSPSAQITIYFTRLTPSDTDDAQATDQTTTLINFDSNSINFIDNDFTTPISTGDAEDGDDRLYLKGGEGSLARIKLFNGDNINDGDDTTFDDFKNSYVDTEDGKFVRSKRLINEAYLVFYVDQDVMQTGEPNRLYLFNADNKTFLRDYELDRPNASIPSFSILNHLGPLQRVGNEPTGAGIKYKMRITEHLNNLLLRDSTNVELGLSVSLNVNLESLQQRKVQSTSNPDLTVPISSVMSPRGTVLHGNTTENVDKRVYLEIYYTEPN